MKNLHQHLQPLYSHYWDEGGITNDLVTFIAKTNSLINYMHCLIMEALCILKSKNRLSFHKGSVQIFQEEDFEKANLFGNPNSVMQPTVFQGSICIKFFVILSIKP